MAMFLVFLSILNIDILSISLIFGILGFGVFISFKILNITDLTVEASYGFGAALCGLCCKNLNPVLGLIIAFLGGSIAGLITALLHTKLKINAILSGILTLTAFYSINLIATNSTTVLAFADNTIFPKNDVLKLLVLLGIVVIIASSISFFFRTKLGLSLRATGDNEQMTKTQCISTDLMKIIGLMLSNGLVALAGALFVEFQGTYFSNIEKGVMVVGVATIIIGEVITLRRHSIELILLGIIGGSIIYRMIYNIALEIDLLQARDMQLVQAIFLIIILVGSIIFDRYSNKKNMNKIYERLSKEEDLNA